ncbi:MAG TPA: cation acetate symporter [Actinomycetes bacterium]
MNTGAGLAAISLVVVATVLIGVYGLRVSRTTSDFMVASRSVPPALNASAICGEYLSAASFLGVAGLVLLNGIDALWFPIGYTAGYLVLLVLVAAPLRRSGAYTLPDFAEERLRSPQVRIITAVLVVVIGWLYLLPQLEGASLTLATVTGAPRWAGATLVAVVVVVVVTAGGMRSITFTQAFQYAIKLVAISVPAIVLIAVWRGHGTPDPFHGAWAEPLAPRQGRSHPLYTTYSLVLATFLGTMGLPHVLVRFYTNPDGRAARRTTVAVLALLGLFYLWPPVYAALGRVYTPDLANSATAADTVVLVLPQRMVGGLGGELLGALVAAGAFAAFLSTASGLTVSVAGVLTQDLLKGGVRSFRLATVVAVLVPLGLTLGLRSLDLASAVGLAFAVAASTICPLLILGIWWSRLTVPGAVAGLAVGATLALAAVAATYLNIAERGWPAALLAQPAAWTVPLAFLSAITVSLLSPRRIPGHTPQLMLRLHAPEGLLAVESPV